jgi:hypothetical protein
VIVVFATILGIVSAKLTGGKLQRLAQLELRHLRVIWITIIVQTLIFQLPPTILSDSVYEVIHLGTYASSFLFLWLNRHIPGALIIGFGAASNALVISANGGVMPASDSAWSRAGLPIFPAGQFENSNTVAEANLAFLGDVFAIPAGWPLANVFSIGDIVIVIGGTYLAHVWCRRPISSNAWPAPLSSELVHQPA